MHSPVHFLSCTASYFYTVKPPVISMVCLTHLKFSGSTFRQRKVKMGEGGMKTKHAGLHSHSSYEVTLQIHSNADRLLLRGRGTATVNEVRS